MGTMCMHGVVPLQVSEGALGRHTPHGAPSRSVTWVAVLTGDSTAQLRRYGHFPLDWVSWSVFRVVSYWPS